MFKCNIPYNLYDMLHTWHFPSHVVSKIFYDHLPAPLLCTVLQSLSFIYIAVVLISVRDGKCGSVTWTDMIEENEAACLHLPNAELMCGAVPPFLQYTFVACTVTTLSLGFTELRYYSKCSATWEGLSRRLYPSQFPTSYGFTWLPLTLHFISYHKITK